MLIQEMKNEIYDYLYNLILDSSLEDWNNRSYIKNNIKIHSYSTHFEVDITTNNNTERIYFNFKNNWFTKKEDKKIKIKLKAKAKEIREYSDNKIEYNKYDNIYNSLSLSLIRKKKLEEINKK